MDRDLACIAAVFAVLILPWLITWVWSWRQAIGIAACYLGSAAVTVLMARFVYTHAAQVWAAVATAFPWWWIGVIYAIIEAVVFLLAATSFLLVDRRARREVSLV